MPLLHACWHYATSGCDCAGCHNETYLDIRTTALRLQGMAKAGDMGAVMEEFTAPDWCCAYKYKVSEYTLSCEHARACND